MSLSESGTFPVVVIGAGPVGLAAAAHLAERGQDYLVLEAGEQVAASVAQWAHVGAGHSAATTLLALAQLEDAQITWAIRAGSPGRTYGGGEADALPARGALGSRLKEHVASGRITLRTGFYAHSVHADGATLTVVSRDPSGAEQSVAADRVVSATGFRPDHSIASELRLDLDPILGSTRALAPLIDPNQHSCGTVPAHGATERLGSHLVRAREQG